MRPYILNDDQCIELASSYLLKKMVQEGWRPSLLLDQPGDKDLEPILEWMMTRQWVHIDSVESGDSFYAPTESGETQARQFQIRYTEYLRIYDVFCAVDLQAGEFAFASYFDLEEPQWGQYLQDPRWDDLRVAVAEFKGIDPVEIVFLSFLQENRFGKTSGAWQFDLALGETWKEVIAVCNNAISMEQLSYEDDQGKVEGTDVIRDVVSQGMALQKKLAQTEQRLVKEGKIQLAGAANPAPDDFWDPYLADPGYTGSFGKN
jgi:hypothetical protein